MYKFTKKQLEDLIYDARKDLRESVANLIDSLPDPIPLRIIIQGSPKPASFAFSAQIENEDFTKIFGDEPYELIGKILLSFEKHFNAVVVFK